MALGAKRLELLRDLVPKIASVGLLVNPNNPSAAVQIKEMQEATTALALQLNVLRAASQSDFDNVFAMLVRQRTDALIVSADPFFLNHRAQLVERALRHSMPAVYYAREFTAAGGLISYASSFTDFISSGGDLRRDSSGVTCLSRHIVEDMLRQKRLVLLKTALPKLQRHFSLIHQRDKYLTRSLQAVQRVLPGTHRDARRSAATPAKGTR